MPFWTTILTALHFRAGRQPVITLPLEVFRVHVDSSTRQRAKADAMTLYRLRVNADVTHRAHMEAL